jgi:GNAT superfamily N-acetyltransferase
MFGSSRRRFLQIAATAGAATTFGGVDLLKNLPRVSAQEAQLNTQRVQLGGGIEPLVQLLEETPREKLLEEVAARIQKGTSYREVVAATLQNSLCFGLYMDDVQIGFARVITDYATMAHLCDVYVLEDYRGRGLGKWLVATVLACPQLAIVGRWSLNTHDAHSLYARYGFEPLASPETAMQLIRTVTPT